MGGGGTRMVMRNTGHEVDPVEGTSSRKNIHRFFPRAAQGPHKVNIGRVVPEANLVKVGGEMSTKHGVGSVEAKNH